MSASVIDLSALYYSSGRVLNSTTVSQPNTGGLFGKTQFGSPTVFGPQGCERSLPTPAPSTCCCECRCRSKCHPQNLVPFVPAQMNQIPFVPSPMPQQSQTVVAPNTSMKQILPFFSLQSLLNFNSDFKERGLRITIEGKEDLKNQLINYIKSTVNAKRVIVAEEEPIYYDMLNVSDFGDLLMKQRQEIEKAMENKTKYGKRGTAIHDLHRMVIIKDDIRINDVFALEERMLTAVNLGMTVICLVKNPPESWKKKTDFVFVDAVSLYANRQAMSYKMMADLRRWIQGEEMEPADYLEVISKCAEFEDTVVIDVQKKKLMALTNKELNDESKE